MRHITWAAAWFLVGLTVVLGTASLIEQRAVLCGDSHARLKPIRPFAQAANHGRELDRFGPRAKHE